VLHSLQTKKEVDNVIKTTEDKVLILRFGREADIVCRQMDDILLKAQTELDNMAAIYIVNVDAVPVYTEYFDITLIPATVFFFNAQHMKVDWGTPDHTKFIGSFKTKQNLIDVAETVYRGAMRGKLIVPSPLDPRDVPKYSLLYKDI
jgi:hypothetical protein